MYTEVKFYIKNKQNTGSPIKYYEILRNITKYTLPPINPNLYTIHQLGITGHRNKFTGIFRGQPGIRLTHCQ